MAKKQISDKNFPATPGKYRVYNESDFVTVTVGNEKRLARYRVYNQDITRPHFKIKKGDGIFVDSNDLVIKDAVYQPTEI